MYCTYCWFLRVLGQVSSMLSTTVQWQQGGVLRASRDPWPVQLFGGGQEAENLLH